MWLPVGVGSVLGAGLLVWVTMAGDVASSASRETVAAVTGNPELPAPVRPETPGHGSAQVDTGADISRGGVAAYKRGNVEASLAEFTRAVEADPDNAPALNNLGQVLVRTGRAQEAIAYFDRAITLSGTTWAYHFNRARAYGELREWPRAAAGYRDAARLFPDDYATAFNLARALQASGDAIGGLTEFERAVALAPGEADFHLSYAQALEAAGRPDDAARVYRQFLELEVDPADADKVRARLARLADPAAASP